MSPASAESVQMPIEQVIAKELAVSPRQIWAAIHLLDSGATVPFIARYRKEATGGLTDTHLRLLAERVEYLREFEIRRQEILRSLDEQGKLSDGLKASLGAATTKTELEDIYLPFRVKKRTRAQAARESGLEPLADAILAEAIRRPEELAAPFADPDKNVADTAAALDGAREILMERFSEDAGVMKSLRAKFQENGYLVSKAVEGKAKPDSKFADYFGFRETVKTLPSHRVLALLRGRTEGELQLSLETEGFAEYSGGSDEREYLEEICRRSGVRLARRPVDAWLLETVRRAWKYKIRIRIELDLMTELRRKAEEEAIRVFAANLKNLLLAAPAGPRPTLGVDPGYRTGVKVAAVDATGKIVDTAAIHPIPPHEDRVGSARILAGMIRRHKIELIAIGNGTASRETEKFIGDLLKANPDLGAQKVLVSEAGASVYSASEAASKELPDLDVTLRGAVSIARRLQDPLAELVKIEPKAIGVGQYQHDVNQRRLEQSLEGVVEDCVNAVGVDINTASQALLSHVAGLNMRTAAEIVSFRQRHGGFRRRAQLLEVPEMGPRAFEQAAGFLRIRGGDNPLDASGVHPEAYPVVERMLAKLGKTIGEVMGKREALSPLKPEDFADESFGELTVRDILLELEKPGRDPRPEFRTAVFREGVQELKDLTPGMTLEGTVTNVANFGAFVDVGVHQDGLVHISQIADEYVDDPHKFLRAGQIVRVRVLEVDLSRKRIALTLRAGQAPRPTGKRS